MKQYLNIFIVLLALSSCQEREIIKGDILITNVNIIDVKDGSVELNKDVVISGKKITHISNKSSFFYYESEKTFDGSNKYLIPGLWDMHAHPDDPEVWRMNPEADKRDLLMPLFVINGVTGIRDMGGSLEVVKDWGKKYSRGDLLIPKIFAGGPLLDGPNPMWDGSVGIKSPTDVPKIVDSLIAEGIDFLKVYSLLPRETYYALSEYANKIKYPFVGHVPFTVSPSEAAITGMKSQEHLLEILKECSKKPSESFLDEVRAIENGIDRSNAINTYRLSTLDMKKVDSLCDLFVEKKIWQCPTLSMWQKNAWYEEELQKDEQLLSFLPNYLQKYWTPEINDHLTNRDNETFVQIKKELYEIYLKIVDRMNLKGVMLLAGTDCGANPLCFPGIGVHNELESLVTAGLSPFDALKTATINPALFFNIEDEYGSVEVGKIADLVLLDKNPLLNISNTRSINLVLRDGKVIDSLKINHLKEEIRSLNSK